jgi:acyl-CoA carboxylase subunit beta
MPVLRSQLDPDSEQARADRAAVLEALERIDGLHRKVLDGGGEKYATRHKGRGKLLVRERLDLLLDEDSAFLELAPLAGTHDPAETVGGVSGIGTVSGVECMIGANDPTVKGGAVGPAGVHKQLRMLEIAERNRLPLISLTESAGADLPRQADIFVPGGASFRDISRLSAAGIPTLSLVFGSSTAGGAYVPGMSEFTVMVKNQAAVYLGGPPLVKMAINEDTDDESLGGADMHARVSGLADYLARDERDAIRIGRQIIADLRWRKAGPGPTESPDAPLYPAEDLLALAPMDLKRPVEVREILARVLDGSRFAEFKPLYGTTLVCGWGSIHGYPVGILANNGILFSEESNKGAHFIQLANARGVPLLFVQNITGFMVGSRYERGGIIKDGAKLINAVSNSTVPHLTVTMGASYGAGNYGMCGRAYGPRFLFTWPNARISVMGGEQAASVLATVKRDNIEADGKTWSAADEDAFKAPIREQYENEGNPYYATARLWDDGIILPSETRRVLALSFSAALNAPIRRTRFGVFRM